MKNTFLDAVSHELRTPLTAILGRRAHPGAATTYELSEAESRDLMSGLATNARKLDRLLGDLLDHRPARSRHRRAEPAADGPRGIWSVACLDESESLGERGR